MPQTATGTYATLIDAKRRLGVADGSDDVMLTLFCDQANATIERVTGRVLAPLPSLVTTLAEEAAAGDTQVALESVATLRAGDAIVFGPLGGTHEHGIVGRARRDGTVLLQYPLTNGYAAGSPVERVQLFDGAEALEGRRMIAVPNGIVSLRALEVAYYTNGPYSAVPMQDVFLGPVPLEREPGWPATELWMTDIPSSGNPGPIFFTGKRNVRAWGEFGWPEIPDEVVEIGLNLVVELYRRRGGSGAAGGVTVNLDGSRTYEHLLNTTDYKLLREYTSKVPSVI